MRTSRVISLLLDKAGLFEWAALHMARWGQGSGKRLFLLLVLLGAAVSAFRGDIFRVGIVLTVPVLLITLAALAVRLSY